MFSTSEVEVIEARETLQNLHSSTKSERLKGQSLYLLSEIALFGGPNSNPSPDVDLAIRLLNQSAFELGNSEAQVRLAALVGSGVKSLGLNQDETLAIILLHAASNSQNPAAHAALG